MRFIAIFLSAMFLFSCSKESDSPQPKTYSDDIKGIWQWYESSGGFGGGIHTPETAGYDLELKIDVDSLSLKKDDSILFVREYFTRMLDDAGFGNINLLVEYIPNTTGWDSIRYRFTIIKDTLSLHPYDLVDAESSYYVRK